MPGIAMNILGNTHLMVSFELHTTWVPFTPPPPPPLPPPSPSPPAPLTPHFHTHVLNGTFPYVPVVGSSPTKTVFTMGYFPMQYPTDIGFMSPHVGFNLYLPLIIAFSSSKSMFGAMTVHFEKKPISIACLVFQNLNFNCNDPVMLPNGVVYAFPQTCQAGFSLMDLLVSGIGILIDYALAALGKKIGDAIMSRLNIAERIAGRLTSLVFVRQSVTTRVAVASVRESVTVVTDRAIVSIQRQTTVVAISTTVRTSITQVVSNSAARAVGVAAEQSVDKVVGAGIGAALGEGVANPVNSAVRSIFSPQSNDQL